MQKINDNLILLPPSKRLMKFYVGSWKRGRKLKTIELAFPFTLFWKTDRPSEIAKYYQNFFIGFCQENPLDDLNTPVYVPPLPHVAFDGSVCLSIEHKSESYKPPVDELISVFFGSINSSTSKVIKSWAKRTAKEKDLSFVTDMDWSWCRYLDTFEKVIEKSKGTINVNW